MEYLDGPPLHRIARRFAEAGATLPRRRALRVIAEALRGPALRARAPRLRRRAARHRAPRREPAEHLRHVRRPGEGRRLRHRQGGESRVETETGVLKGSVAYMAPEQAWVGDVDRRADVFAVGVMIWEAAAGQAPLAGQDVRRRDPRAAAARRARRGCVTRCRASLPSSTRCARGRWPAIRQTGTPARPHCSMSSRPTSPAAAT